MAGDPHAGTRRAGVARVERGGLNVGLHGCSSRTRRRAARGSSTAATAPASLITSWASLLQRVQILERVDIAQPAGVDQAHVDVADLGAP